MFQSRQMTQPVSDKDIGRWHLGKGASLSDDRPGMRYARFRQVFR